jgi:micrococcal nuclease
MRLSLSLFLGLSMLSISPTLYAADVSWREIKQQWSRLWIKPETCTVKRVVDGDTAHVECGGRLEKLRLVGIDTPETKHPFRPVEYFGPEASARAKQLLRLGAAVYLGFKGQPGQKKRGRRGGRDPHRDAYRRLLAYLFTADGKMFNAQMVREGYAFAMTRFPHPYMDEFVQLEAEARKARRGMWARPDLVQAMQAKENQYREQRRQCNDKLGVRRFNWVIGDTKARIYFEKGHRAYFRTDYRTRVLFCSTQDATAAGYRPAPSDHRFPEQDDSSAASPAPTDSRLRPNDLPPPAPTRDGVAAPPPPQGGDLILGNPKRNTYRVLRAGKYRIFRTEAEAEAAGFRRSGKRSGKRRGKRAKADDDGGGDGDSDQGSKRSKRSGGKYARSLEELKERCNTAKPIVGNRRSKLYRTPENKGYKKALQSTSKSVVFFCNEKEAQDAGFNAAKR